MPLDFPNNPTPGQIYDNYYWDNANQIWRASGIVTPKIPAGIISQYAGSVAPEGYLFCQGQSILTAQYPALFAAIGYTYGGSSLNFNVPNLQHRVPVGRGTEAEFDTLGETGGSKTHTLTVDEMPSHTHLQNSHNHTQNSHNHTHRQWIFNGASHSGGNRYGFGYAGNTGAANDTASYSTSGEVQYGNYPTTATNNAATATNQNTGGGQAHNNLQPYIVLNYIIKT